MSQPTKTVGVIGGLGPLATLDFFERVLRRTRTYKEEDHLRLIIDNNTKVPDRNAFGRGEGPSPAPALAASAKGLETAGADFIVMACNTAHAWEAEIRNAITVPFVSMIDEREPFGNAKNWGSGFLPAVYQGTLFRQGPNPILNTKLPAGQTDEKQRARLEFLAAQNREYAAAHPDDTTIEARIRSFELAYSLQKSGPEVVDLSGETEETKALYGLDKPETAVFGRNCLLGRRLGRPLGGLLGGLALVLGPFRVDCASSRAESAIARCHADGVARDVC